MAKIMMRGDLLPPALQREALACYVHRFTAEHRPQWARDAMSSGEAYPVQFADDAQWLARTLFPVIVREPARDSAIRLAAGDCYSSPYWPDGIPAGQIRAENILSQMDCRI